MSHRDRVRDRVRKRLGLPDVKKCERCNGCGQVADSETGEPWSYWEELPPGSDIAVRMGIVKPKSCPVCDGKGRR